MTKSRIYLTYIIIQWHHKKQQKMKERMMKLHVRDEFFNY